MNDSVTSGPQDTDTSRRRRPPTMYALLGVVVLTLVGVGLFVWGPLNPYVTVGTESTASAGVTDWIGALLGTRGSFGSGQSAGPNGQAQTDLVVTNHSLASVELVSVRTARVTPEDASGDPDLGLPRIIGVTGIPARVTHGSDATVSVTVDARRACVANHGGTVRYQLLIDARTASGVHRTIGGDGHQSVTCGAAALPAPGPGPVDPAKARAGIAKAFDATYDFAAPPMRRRVAIDHPAGLDGLVAQVSAGPYGGIARSVGVRVIEVVFTSPTQATVLYELTGVPGTIGGARIGHARLIDGDWKVTRATVCADLALAQVSCPRS